MEIELVVMAGPEFQRHAEPSVVCSVAELEMGNGEGKMPADDLLPYGMTVKQFANGAVVARFLQAADIFGFVVQGVGNADVGIHQAVGVEHRAAEGTFAEGDGGTTHESIFAG